MGAENVRSLRGGAVFQYRHHNQALGSMVVLLCNTDFAARSPEFQNLGESLALQVAALGADGVEALLAQPLVRDESRTVGQLVTEVAVQIGEVVQVREFCRFQV